MVKTSKSKSNGNQSMVTKKNTDWIKDFINSTFDDKCAYDASGSKIRGPGLLCGTWIILIVFGTLTSIVWSWKYVDGITLTWTDIIIQNIIDILITSVVVVFGYNMCNICRGFVGFLVVWVIVTIISSIRWYFFSSYRTALMANLSSNDR